MKKLIILILTLGLIACSSIKDKVERRERKSSIIDTLTLTNTQTPITNSLEIQTNDCNRGQAKPVIQKKVYPNTIFILQSDSITAIETVTFENGDKLIIRNWGCEYYVLTFRFETTKFQQDTANLEYWFKAANKLMNSMLSGLDTPIDIKRGLVFLNSYILKDERNKFKNLTLGEEIDFGGIEKRSFVTIDRIEKLTNKKYSVTISFANGSL